MAAEIFHDQIFMKDCAGHEDRSRYRLHPKRHRYRPIASYMCTAPGGIVILVIFDVGFNDRTLVMILPVPGHCLLIRR